MFRVSSSILKNKLYLEFLDRNDHVLNTDLYSEESAMFFSQLNMATKEKNR